MTPQRQARIAIGFLLTVGTGAAIGVLAALTMPGYYIGTALR